LAKVCFDKDAKYDEATGGTAWMVSHKFRRYVRPVLAQDPLLAAGRERDLAPQWVGGRHQAAPGPAAPTSAASTAGGA